jgi:bla regulator protein BlaR1
MISNELQPLANHLWQSTLFAAVAGLAMLALRKNRAKVRLQLWFIASIKLLVPFSILIRAGSHLGLRRAAAAAPSGLSSVIEQVSMPFATPISAAPMAVVQHSPLTWIPTILAVVWAIGLVTLAYSWWRRWRNMRGALLASSRLQLPLPLPIDLKVMTSAAFREPGVFGIFRPILLLPEGITDRLTPAELQAILKHELCHVRRRDNLATAIHMVVEAVFWFHPLVWWLGNRLVEERERACDEEVLLMGSEPQVYAEGILKVCELYLESQWPCVAGVAGGDLTRRIEAIMLNQIAFELGFSRKALLIVAGFIAVALPVLVGIVNSSAAGAQTMDARAPDAIPRWQTAAGGKMAFEVASIRQTAPGKFTSPNFPLDAGNAYASTGGRFSADFAVTTYLEFAYKIWLTHEQKQSLVANLPKWVTNDQFTIQANAAKDNPTKDQMRLMVQSLLADRFQLSMHFETQEVPVFALALVTAGKTGPKLRPHSEGVPCDSPATRTGRGADVFPEVCDINVLEGHRDGNVAGSRNTIIELIAGTFPALGRLGRPVVDQTGLSGRFDFRLDWVPEPDGPVTGDNPPDFRGPTFQEALHDQLGLKLKATVGPIRTPVIDHIERPSEN